MEVTKGKRYWFHDRQFIYSALFTGEYDSRNGNGIFTRRNGDEWSIPIQDVFQSKEELIKHTGLKHGTMIDRK